MVLANLMGLSRELPGGQPPSQRSFANRPISEFSWLLTSMQTGRGKASFSSAVCKKEKEKRSTHCWHCWGTYSIYFWNKHKAQAEQGGSHVAQPNSDWASPCLWILRSGWIQALHNGQQEPAQGPIHSALRSLQTGNFCVMFSEMPPKSSLGS